jgi:hypothetical protein
MTTKTTAIAGVSSSDEVEIRTKYPSIGPTPIGRILSFIYDLIPVRIYGFRLSCLLFGLPTAPLAVAGYVFAKIAGERWVLTNRSIQRWSSLGKRMLQSVSLTDIDEIAIEYEPGENFFRCANLHLQGAGGKTLMVLRGVNYPEVFRETLLKSRESRTQVEESLAIIQARG